MQRPARNVLIQVPPAAPIGFPVAVNHHDGKERPHHVAGPHAHGFFAMLLVTSGRGVIRCGRTDLEVAEGSFVVTAPGEVHDTTGMIGVARFGVDFSPDVFGAEGAGWLFPRPSRPEWIVLLRRSWDAPQVIDVPPEKRPEWHRMIGTIAEELETRPHGYREIVRAELKSLLIRTSRLVARGLAPASETVPPLLGEVFDAIEAQFGDACSLSSVARTVSRSPAHLTTVVRQATGMTVQQWIIERRMAEARQRLLVSDEHIDVLAERVGYRDPTLFIRHFKRAHGVTPRRFRLGQYGTNGSRTR